MRCVLRHQNQDVWNLLVFAAIVTGVGSHSTTEDPGNLTVVHLYCLNTLLL